VWSSDGTRLAGIVQLPSGRRTLGLYSLDSKTYRTIDRDAEDPAVWLGEKSLLFLRSGGLFATDIASDAEHEVVTSEQLARGGVAGFIYTYALSRDQRSLFLILWRNQADVWQLTLP
jgi:hypothetical protein